MSGSSGTTWLKLLDDKKSWVTENGSEISPAIWSEATFRTAFENLCRQRKEKYIPRLQAKLLPSYTSIITFTSAVGGHVKNLPPDSLTALVWEASFATIKSGCRAGAKLERLVTLLVELNNSVPIFSADVTQYPDDPDVQKPLQDILDEYIGSYIFMVSSFRKMAPPSTFDPSLDIPLKDHLTEVATKFAEAKNRHQVRVDLAVKNAESEQLRAQQPGFNRQLSLPNLIQAENLHPYDIQPRFVSQRRLGVGSCGDVDEVQETSTQQVYARKHIHIAEDSSRTDGVPQEVTIMQRLRHHHIANVLFYVKERDGYSILMSPVADSDLWYYLDRCAREAYPASLITPMYQWFGCLAHALAFAHRLNIKHRDIKPSNILIKDGQPLLSDFGLARDFTDEGTSLSESHVQGTSIYFAPECEPGTRRGRRADIFALGCVYAEMLTISNGKSIQQFRDFRRTTHGVITFRQNLAKVMEWLSEFKGDHRNDLLINQIERMLQEVPDKRPLAQEVVNIFRSDQSLFCVQE